MMVARLVVGVLAFGAAALMREETPRNVSRVPVGFTSAKETSMFKARGWELAKGDDCDKYIHTRVFDGACMRPPRPTEILPLLVTGSKGAVPREVHAMLAAMGLSSEYDEYGAQATVSWARAVNDFVAAVPYPEAHERTTWWAARQISNKVDYENVFKPRFSYVVHLTRCPIDVLTSLLAASAPERRFVEAATRWPRLEVPCSATYDCLDDYGYLDRLGWAVSTYVAWNAHLDTYAHQRLQVEALAGADGKRIATDLCARASANSRKPHNCHERAEMATFPTDLQLKGPRPSRRDLRNAVFPPYVDGPATLRAFDDMNARYGYEGPCVGGKEDSPETPDFAWLYREHRLVRGTDGDVRRATDPGAHTKAGIEQCLLSGGNQKDACNIHDTCPSTTTATTVPPRDCLRARVLFRTPYARMKCCFKCCLLHWLGTTRLGENIQFHANHVEDKLDVNYHKANPDSGDFGIDPLLNLLVHPHAFAVVSDVHIHPHKGCHMTRPLSDIRDAVIASSYHIIPERILGHTAPNAPKTSEPWLKSPFWPCIQSIRQASVPLVMDFFHPAKYEPLPETLKNVKLVTANNLANKTKAATADLWSRARERVIGVRGVSLWQALLEHPEVEALPRDERLLLCCCMNVDSAHPGRMEHTKVLARFAEFNCPVTAGSVGHHIHEPLGDRGVHPIESDVILVLNGRYGNVKGMKGNYDTHMPVNMFASKFVYSPNGVGEQCYREYEALISGAIPLVDDTAYEARKAILSALPVVLVRNWTTVTPEFLERTYADMARKSFDVSILFMPYWYDAILTAMGIDS